MIKTRKKSDDTQLNKYRSGQFHSTKAKLLFLVKHGRLAVSFLTTRVKSPDLDNWKKLLRILGYLQGTMELELTIKCDDIKTFTWYIDGVVLSRLNKQKVKTGSSTETELIAVDDTLPTL